MSCWPGPPHCRPATAKIRPGLPWALGPGAGLGVPGKGHLCPFYRKTLYRRPRWEIPAFILSDVHSS